MGEYIIHILFIESINLDPNVCKHGRMIYLFIINLLRSLSYEQLYIVLKPRGKYPISLTM